MVGVSQMTNVSVGDEVAVGADLPVPDVSSGLKLEAKLAEDTKIAAKLEDGADIATGVTTPSASKPSVVSDFVWHSEELGKFWENCFPPGTNVFLFDGLHPKALCSKICNDVLRTNININSSSSNPNDRLLCFEVLQNLEDKFIMHGVVEAPVQKPGGNPNHKLYKRVSHTDWNGFAGILGDQTLEAWARDRVEESIKKLTKPVRR